MRMEVAWIWLLLLPTLIWVWWLSRRSYAQLRPWARRASLLLRAALLICLLAALSRPIWTRSTSGQHVVFLLDVSRSITRDNLASAIANIDKMGADAAAKGHRPSLVAFGRSARQLVPPASSWKPLDQQQRALVLHDTELAELNAQRARLAAGAKAPAESADTGTLKDLDARIQAVETFRAEVVGEQTDAAAALRLALNSGEVGEAKTVYLFTDANFNRGDWTEGFDTAAAAGHTVRVVALDKPVPPEVAAADLTLPPTVRVNQGFSADLRIASTVETTAQVAVFRDGYAAGEFTQTLKAGDNRVRIPSLYFREKGFHTVEVAVRPKQDTRVENNRIRAMVTVPGELRVLYVDSDEQQQSYLANALGLEGVQVQKRPASGVPRSLDDLLGFDAFILSNVPADRLSMSQMQMVRSYVQDFGGGFIMLGGDQSFGLGGYYGTPIEEVLPVRMPIQKDLNRPSLAIMLVIDKSGSMTGAKIQLAKRAAAATAEVINPRDQVGVIAFDSEAQSILDLTPASDKATIAARIATLEAGGGTFLYPGLDIARSQLQQSSARKKHVIVLSDGQTEGFGYAEIAQMMAAEGITVSTVGIGEGADRKLMEDIASAGAGRTYFTNDFNSIPQIFTREALRAANSMLVERLVVPSVAADDEAISEIESTDLPPLSGYVATTPKESAKVVLLSDSGDPLMARWRSGLGRTAAFTSDTKPRWAEDWIRWPDFAKFWAQLVRGVAGQNVNRDVSIDTARRVGSDAGTGNDDVIIVTADLRDAAGNYVSDRSLELMAFDPKSGAHPVLVEHEGPGLYTAKVPRGEYGQSRQLAWHLSDDKQTAGSRAPGGVGTAPANTPAGTTADTTQAGGLTVPFGFVESFSPEFATLGPDESTLAQFRQRGVDVAKVGDADLDLAPLTGEQRVVLWPWLLILAALLAPLDILCRRLG